MFLTEATAITVGQTAALVVNRVKTDGVVTGSTQTDAAQSNLISGAALVLQTTAGAITTETTGAVTATGNLLLKAGGATSDLTLGEVVTNTAAGGNTSLDAGQDVLQNANVMAQTSGRTVDVLAGRHITMAQGTQTSTTNGNLLLQATAGNITIETLNAGTANVSVTATAGNVIDGDTAGDTEVDITAAGLLLTAGSSSGIGSGSNHLETSVSNLTAVAGSGGVFVTETDAVTVTS